MSNPRVFLSYAVRDASEVAERLHRDLATRGYEVWQDVNRLRAGRPWDEGVSEGLRNAQVLLALLSPESVHRALVYDDDPTATYNVCLDEIAYARGARKIPIVPVRVFSCEAPFLIYRLNQIDFRRWAESEAAYQEGLDQICAAITEAVQSGKPRERPWRLPQPLDFDPFILEKRRDFIGRQWFFREIDKWRATGRLSVLLIVGEPGIGKSAIVAALVHKNPESQVLAYHCCRADTPATLDTGRFVRGLVEMVSDQIEGYAAMLDDPGIKKALDRADTDAASAFEAAILGPLHKVPKPYGNRRYLLIDALDEALAHPNPTIVDVLCARLRLMPPWLGIVATTRSARGVLRQLRGLPVQTLEANDSKNQDDVRTFLQLRLSEPNLRAKAEASGKTLQELQTSLLRSSAYNFLFVVTALEAVESRKLRFDEIDRLPPGLSSLYEVFFDRLFRDARVDFAPTNRVLEVIVAAPEPLTREQIAAFTALDAEKELPFLLDHLAAFIPVRDGRYLLFHRSLFEWLTGWDTQQDQPFAGPYHVSLQDGHKRLTDWGQQSTDRAKDSPVAVLAKSYKDIMKPPVDFVIVTALEEERDAVLAKLPGYRQIPPSEEDVRVYFGCDLPATFSDGSVRSYRVVVVPLLNMGRVEAANATGDAIRRWHPSYLLLIGIAGGVSEMGVSLGDILISDQIVDYELQKITESGPEVRYSVHRADPRLLGAAKNYLSDAWLKLIILKRPRKGTPKRKVGPVSTGDKVIAFKDLLANYRDDWPKLIRRDGSWRCG